MSLVKFIKNFQEKYPKLSEIIRFVIFGGICTIIDMFVMGIVLYVFEPSIYPNFFNVFYGGGEPKTIATVIGTGAGFTVSVICNYLFSTFIVFKEKGRSKSVNGVVLFDYRDSRGFLFCRLFCNPLLIVLYCQDNQTYLRDKHNQKMSDFWRFFD